MKLPFISDRRGGDGRRKRERRANPRSGSDRRANQDRRLDQRREFVRLVYPLGAEPKIISYPTEASPKLIKSEPEILATDFRVADLSKKSIKFICLIKCAKCTHPMRFNDKITFTLQFHDEEVIDLEAKVVRYFGELRTKTGTFVTLLSANLSSERIKKEQAYLLKNFPDFCREHQVDQRTLEEDPVPTK